MKRCDLLHIGRRYMVQAIHLDPVLVEYTPPLSLNWVPDLIGWKLDIGYGGTYVLNSYIIDVRASISEFRKDSANKARSKSSLGQNRYYLTPDGLVHKSDLPEGWGLIYYNTRTKRCRKVVQSAFRSRVDVERQEGLLLRSVAQHYKQED